MPNIVALLTVLYALSIGPSFLLVHKRVISQQAFEATYAPLVHATRSVRIDKPLYRYMRSWVD